MQITTENKWGFGLMLISVALAVFVGKVLGAICGIAGIVLIIHAQISHKAANVKVADALGEGYAALGFVLEVAGSQSLEAENSDWQFYLTNCMSRIVRSVRLYNIRSEVGAYELGFHEIPVMRPGDKALLSYEVSSRRSDDRGSEQRARLWDFAKDHAGERGTTFIWYDILITYREADNDKEHTGGFVSVCFDLQNKKLKTEGADLYRQDRISKRVFPYNA